MAACAASPSTARRCRCERAGRASGAVAPAAWRSRRGAGRRRASRGPGFRIPPQRGLARRASAPRWRFRCRGEGAGSGGLRGRRFAVVACPRTPVLSSHHLPPPSSMGRAGRGGDRDPPVLIWPARCHGRRAGPTGHGRRFVRVARSRRRRALRLRRSCPPIPPSCGTRRLRPRFDRHSPILALCAPRYGG